MSNTFDDSLKPSASEAKETHNASAEFRFNVEQMRVIALTMAQFVKNACPVCDGANYLIYPAPVFQIVLLRVREKDMELKLKRMIRVDCMGCPNSLWFDWERMNLDASFEALAPKDPFAGLDLTKIKIS